MPAILLAGEGALNEFLYLRLWC